MSQFNYGKIIATIWPSIAKETVLVKIINNIDVFRIDFSKDNQEVHKKYIESLRKIDNSKSILIDLKWPEIKTRNDFDVKVKKWQEINMKFSQLFKDEEWSFFIDYPHLSQIPVWQNMQIEETAKLQIKKVSDDVILCKVLEDWVIKPNRAVRVENYNPKLPFLSDNDMKNIIWWIKNGINIISVWGARSSEDMHLLKKFLIENGGENVRIIIKLNMKEWVDNIEDIIDMSDWIILSKELLKNVLSDKEFDKFRDRLVQISKKYVKPIMLDTSILWKKDKLDSDKVNYIIQALKLGIDGFMLWDETAYSDYSLEAVLGLYKTIIDNQHLLEANPLDFDKIKIDNCDEITEYTMFNACRIAKELKIMVMICPTENGYAPLKLSSFKPNIPIIAFTKNDDTYRYLNLIWAVKCFKIASWFDYDNLKRIWKEIVKYMHKWDMFLDDKVLIVHSTVSQSTLNMINGIEIYRFKDM